MGRIATAGRDDGVRYCGVGCNLELHVQEGTIVNVTSPDDHDVTLGNLCIKGRFGYRFVETG